MLFQFSEYNFLNFPKRADRSFSSLVDWFSLEYFSVLFLFMFIKLFFNVRFVNCVLQNLINSGYLLQNSKTDKNILKRAEDISFAQLYVQLMLSSKIRPTKLFLIRQQIANQQPPGNYHPRRSAERGDAAGTGSAAEPDDDLNANMTGTLITAAVRGADCTAVVVGQCIYTVIPALTTNTGIGGETS